MSPRATHLHPKTSAAVGRPLLRCLAVVVGLAMATGCASTDQAGPVSRRAESARWPTLGLRAGAAVLASFDSDIGVASAPLNASASGSLEDTFSDNDRIGITRVDLFWRIDDDRRHRVDVNWFELTRTGDPRLIDDGKFFETPPMAGPVEGVRPLPRKKPAK